MKIKKSYFGIDVSAKELVLADVNNKSKTFSNNSSGHKQIFDFLKSRNSEVYVCMEATGVYSLDIATVLSNVKGINVMVVNPKSAKDFASACMNRSKTDRVDAHSLALYASKFDFIKWVPPSRQFYEIRIISRRIQALKQDIAAEKNRLHAYKATAFTPAIVIQSTIDNIKALLKLIKELHKQALLLIREDKALSQKFSLLTSISGIASLSAIYCLAEIAFLPDDITPKQLTAYAGLDPRKFESGTSIKKREAISKKGNAALRKALFLPALVAIRFNPIVKKFFINFVARGKQKKQAIVAIMRKFIHAILGMFKSNRPFDATLCFNV